MDNIEVFDTSKATDEEFRAIIGNRAFISLPAADSAPKEESKGRKLLDATASADADQWGHGGGGGGWRSGGWPGRWWPERSHGHYGGGCRRTCCGRWNCWCCGGHGW